MKCSDLYWTKIWWHRRRQLLWNTEGFLVGISDSELLEFLDSTMLIFAYSYKVGEKPRCKEGISLGVSEWYIEGIPEYTMINASEDCIECN